MLSTVRRMPKFSQYLAALYSNKISKNSDFAFTFIEENNNENNNKKFVLAQKFQLNWSCWSRERELGGERGAEIHTFSLSLSLTLSRTLSHIRTERERERERDCDSFFQKLRKN